MKSTTQSPLFKTLLLSGALLTGWAVNAQSTNPPPPDSANHQWRHRPGGPGGRDGQGFGQRGPGQQDKQGPGKGFRPGSQGGRDMAWGHRRGPGEHGREHIRYTPEQRKQVLAINKEFHQKETDLYAKDNITLKEYKSSLASLRKEKKGRLDALLTPQQKEEIAKHKQQADENRQVMAAAHMERLKLRLNLSDDQVSKLKTGQEKLHQQITAIHENENLQPEQKFQQMKDLMAKRNDIYKSVLTPDQFTKFEQMHHRPDGFRGHDGQKGPRGDRGPGGRDRGFGDSADAPDHDGPGFDGPGFDGPGGQHAPGNQLAPGSDDDGDMPGPDGETSI